MKALARILFLVVAAAIGFAVGDSYIGRLPNHAGYHLVPVTDAVGTPIPVRPRRALFVVVDGLRRDSAETMEAARVLASHGQCRVSDQGSYTVSRPMYALLSTGLEVDRHGARNNENSAPLAAESIWQVARESGLRVFGSSHLPWFKELFPGGFDAFSLAHTHEDDVFATPLGDVTVVHPLYVDEAGHQSGGASPAYAAAVKRVDGELLRALAAIDFEQDLVVLTADHGHRDAGGHGGAQPEINHVLICFAGRNVAHREGRLAFDGRSTAPALALLLGLRFPRHMRAVEDDLDVLSEILVDDAAFAPYRADRVRAVEHFRAENRAYLENALGGPPGTWSRLYAHDARTQLFRAIPVLLLAGFILFFKTKRSTLATVALSALLLWGVHHLVLGDFDYTVINLKVRYVPRAVLVSAMAWVGVALFARKRVVFDLGVVVALLLVVNVGLVFVFGAPLGFPLPPPAARYFPFFGAIALLVFGMLTAIAAVVAQVRK